MIDYEIYYDKDSVKPFIVYASLDEVIIKECGSYKTYSEALSVLQTKQRLELQSYSSEGYNN